MHATGFPFLFAKVSCLPKFLVGSGYISVLILFDLKLLANSFAYGKNSPYRQLLNKDSHVMLIDVTFFYNSMFHMAELDAKVPYRKNKKFVFGKKTFNLFAREKSNLFLDYKKFEKINEIKRLKKQINFKGIKITLLDYKKLYKQSLKVLKKNPNFLLSKK